MKRKSILIHLLTLTFIILNSVHVFAENEKRKVPERFQYFIESFTDNIKNGFNFYESYLFDVETTLTDSLGNFILQAKLKRGKIINNVANSNRVTTDGFLGDRNGSLFYETDFPVDQTSTRSLLINFLEDKVLQYSISPDGKTKCLNVETIQNQFKTYLSINGKQLRKSLHASMEKTITSAYLNNFFNSLIIKIPEEVEKPGDLGLVGRKVFELKSIHKNLYKVEINRVKHYIDPETNLAWVSKGGKRRVIIEQPSENKNQLFNTWITGELDDKNRNQLKLHKEELSMYKSVEEITVPVNDTGRFNVAFNIEEPIFLKLDDELEIYCEPGDDLQLNIISSVDSIIFTGIGEEDNRYLQQKKNTIIDKRRLINMTPEKDRMLFKKIDDAKQHNLKLLDLYKGDLSLRFLEHQYTSEYYGAINKNIYVKRHQFQWEYTNSPETFDWYTSILPSYQTFITNKQYNKFVDFDVCHQLDKINNFKYRALYNTSEVISDPDFLRFSGIYLKGKQFVDFLFKQARQCAATNNFIKIKDLEKIASDKFPESPLHGYISNIRKSQITTADGSIFPNIKLVDDRGIPTKLPLRRNKINYLMFWWNDAFILNAEWEEYKQLVEENDGKIQFINIGIDDSFDSWKEQVKTVGFPGTNLFLSIDDEIFKKYFRHLKSRHYFMLDENGIIVDNNGPQPNDAADVFQQHKMISRSNLFEILALITGILVLVSLIIIAIIKRNARRTSKIESIKRKLKEVELRAIKSQMNPHFLFNSLNSIQSMVNQGSVENANIYLSKFACLLRSVLNNSEHEFIPINEEIENIKLYCELEKLRFNFSFRLKISPQIDLHNTLFPPLLMQPYIENAILHGLHPKSGDKKLSVEIDEIDQQLLCTIRDNGIGRNSSFTGHKGNGLGMKLCAERINVLNEKNESDFKVEVIDLTDNENNPEGTEIVISFSNNLI